jgi:hypothetical protein
MGAGASAGEVRPPGAKYLDSTETGQTSENSSVQEGEEKTFDDNTLLAWPLKNEAAKFRKDGAIESWDFNIWNVASEELPALCSAIILHYSIPTKLNIRYEKWLNLYNDVEGSMSNPNNPYHNFVHLVDVMQTCAAFLGDIAASHLMNDTTTFALLLSAFVHDMGHPGLNNTYQVNAETKLAILYNDISVLENHHCALAFDMFKKADTNVFEDMAVASRKSVRKTMIELILSTDMSIHFALADQLNECVTRIFVPLRSSHAMETVVLQERDRVTVLRALLHAADISNPAKKWETSKKWSDLVVQEFFEQGDREKVEGLPVSLNMDRTTSHQDEISVNFSDFIVAPFFLTLLNALPRCVTPVQHIVANRKKWHELVLKRIDSSALEDAQKVEQKAKWTKKDADFCAKAQQHLDTARSKLLASGVVLPPPE